MTRHEATDFKNALVNQPWRLWLSQLRTIVSIENRRNLFTFRSFWVYFLAFAPTAIVFIHAVFGGRFGRDSMPEDTQALAAIFQFYYLRLGIFFGTLGIFTRLIRGEMIERSLHYYLLAPVRREVLLLGKFIAGSVRALVLFEAAVFLSFWMMYYPFGDAGHQYIFDGPGGHELAAYLGITALAVLGYGAVFLLFSMLFKNPAVPALVYMGWEAISSILPSFLQRFSITSYLRQLMPISVPGEGIFALLTVTTEPIPAWLSVTGALILTAAVLVISCYRMRTLEISYTTE
jgi:ABC-type transport system involved in multi-copper enzyme maturation permease subunit